MDRTKVMELADKVGGLFRLTVLLQKRVAELVAGAPKLVDTKEINPIRIAMLEVEADCIDLVNLTDEELAQLEAQTQMATDEAELLEALRSRMTRNLAAQPEPAAGGGGYEADDDDD
jgi:DNA-directed RNA polymerase subunit K/omega